MNVLSPPKIPIDLEKKKMSEDKSIENNNGIIQKDQKDYVYWLLTLLAMLLVKQAVYWYGFWYGFWYFYVR